MPGAEADRAERPAGVRSIDRALSILEQLAMADRACSLSELSSSAGLSMGTTHRVVRTLVARGYVRQLATREYVLGPSLVGLGDKARYGTGIGVESRLQDLAERAGGTAGLAVLDGPDVVFVAQAAPPHQGVRMVLELGERMPFGSTAIADAILASLPPGTPSHRPAPDLRRRHRDPDLAARLEQVRRRGYAVDDGQDNGGVRCLAVGLTRQPVPAALALLGVAGSSAEFGTSRVLELLKSVASALSRDLGRRE
jgi:IclR family transcriptional regulator, acetate operon repressor